MTTNTTSHKMNGTAKEALAYALTKVGSFENFENEYSYTAPLYSDDKFIGYTRAQMSKMTTSYTEARKQYNLSILEAAIWYSRTHVDDIDLICYLDKIDQCTKKDLIRLIKDF